MATSLEALFFARRPLVTASLPGREPLFRGPDYIRVVSIAGASGLKAKRYRFGMKIPRGSFLSGASGWPVLNREPHLEQLVSGGLSYGISFVCQ